MILPPILARGYAGAPVPRHARVKGRWLDRGCVRAYVGGVDLVNGWFYDNTGAPRLAQITNESGGLAARVFTNRGPAIVIDSTGIGANVGFVTPSSNKFSIVLASRIDTSGSFHYLLRNDTHQFGLASEHSGTSGNVIYYDGSNIHNSGFSIQGDLRVPCYGFTCNSNVFTFYKGGAKGNVSAVGSTPAGKWQFADGANSTGVDSVAFAFFFERVLTENEMRDLTAEPAILFEDERLAVPYDAGGAAPSSGSPAAYYAMMRGM